MRVCPVTCGPLRRRSTLVRVGPSCVSVVCSFRSFVRVCPCPSDSVKLSPCLKKLVFHRRLPPARHLSERLELPWRIIAWTTELEAARGCHHLRLSIGWSPLMRRVATSASAECLRRFTSSHVDRPDCTLGNECTFQHRGIRLYTYRYRPG